MNLLKKNCYAMFAATCFLTLFFPIFFPSIRLMFFAPYLIVLFYKQPYHRCLWGAFLCGFIIDLLSSQTRMGLTALNYTVTTVLLYKQRLNFFGDNQSTLPIMTLLFAFISTAFQWALMLMFDKSFDITLNGLAADFAAMPIFDAVYAYIAFILPWVWLHPKPRKGSDYFV